jgi:hypothetical protein
MTFGREAYKEKWYVHWLGHRTPWGRTFPHQTSWSARCSQGIWLPPLSVTQHTILRTLKETLHYLSMALRSLVGPWPLFQFIEIFTQSVELLGRGISLSQGLYLHTGQHKHRINAHRHPCFKWNSNPRSQCFRGRRQFLPSTARPLWSANITLRWWT